MQHYPLFLNLAAADILIVGAGSVGRRKLAGLLPCAPRSVTLVDPALSPAAMHDLKARGPVICRARGFVPRDIRGKSLVFAAAGSREVNALVAALCRGKAIFCNVADAPEQSDFFVPAQCARGGITLAVSTGGQSPALAKRLREELEVWLGTRYADLVTLLGRLRPHLLALDLPTEKNTEIFQSMVNSPLAELLEKGRRAAAETLLLEQLPKALHASIGDLLHGL
jgi:precorrin-2 dehydrogenase/sirohydrochlorin ferrochelatase